MANQYPGTVNITAYGINGNSVLKQFTAVKAINVDLFENTINVVDATGSFYFGYSAMGTVTWTISGGTTTVTIS